MSTEITLGDLVANGSNVVVANEDTTIDCLLKSLQNDEKTVIGVVDKHDDFIGLINTFDIMTYVAYSGCPDDKLDENRVKSVFSTPIGNLTGVFHKETNRIWGYDQNAPLSKILEPMCKGVHRAIVIMNDGTLKLISQTDLLKYAFDNIDKFPVAKKQLGEIELHSKPVISLPNDRPVLHGFKRMEMEQVLALPIVDARGSLVAVLSSSDIKRVNTSNMGNILLPVCEFLRENGQLREPEIVKKTDTLESVISMLLNAHIHHTWIVDESNTPVLTISYSDIIKLLWSVV